jgi:hypothetical protein
MSAVSRMVQGDKRKWTSSEILCIPSGIRFQSLRSAALLRICNARELEGAYFNCNWYIKVDDLCKLVNCAKTVSTGGGPLMDFLQRSIADVYTRKQSDTLQCIPQLSVVYALCSENFPGVKKIGTTSKPMRVRLSNINCGLPVNPFEVVVTFKTFDGMASEKEAHEYFDKQHVNKEFFKLSSDEVQTYFIAKQKAFEKEALQRMMTVRANRTKLNIFEAWRCVSDNSLKVELLGDDWQQTSKMSSINHALYLIMNLPGTMCVATRIKVCAYLDALKMRQTGGADIEERHGGTKRSYEDISADDDGVESITTILADFEARCKIIRDSYDYLIKINRDVIDDDVRLSMRGMLMRNVLAIAAIEPTVATEATLCTEQESHFKLMCDVTNKIYEIQERVGDEDVRKELKDMFMNKFRTISAIEPTVSTEDPKSSYGWLYALESQKYPGHLRIGYTYKLQETIAAGRWFTQDDTHFLVACVPTFNPIRDEKLTHNYFASVRSIREGSSAVRFVTSATSVQRYFHDFVLPLAMAEDYDYQILP